MASTAWTFVLSGLLGDRRYCRAVREIQLGIKTFVRRFVGDNIQNAVLAGGYKDIKLKHNSC